MAKVYKVWIEIEEYDEDTEEGETVALMDFASTADFANAEDARTFAIQLHRIGTAIDEGRA
jgi:hypothetical protein